MEIQSCLDEVKDFFEILDSEEVKTFLKEECMGNVTFKQVKPLEDIGYFLYFQMTINGLIYRMYLSFLCIEGYKNFSFRKECAEIDDVTYFTAHYSKKDKQLTLNYKSRTKNEENIVVTSFHKSKQFFSYRRNKFSANFVANKIEYKELELDELFDSSFNRFACDFILVDNYCTNDSHTYLVNCNNKREYVNEVDLQEELEKIALAKEIYALSLVK